jgi:hypothetical protein
VRVASPSRLRAAPGRARPAARRLSAISPDPWAATAERVQSRFPVRGTQPCRAPIR